MTFFFICFLKYYKFIDIYIINSIESLYMIAMLYMRSLYVCGAILALNFRGDFTHTTDAMGHP